MLKDHISLSTRIKYLQELNLLQRNPSKITERLNLFTHFKIFSQKCTGSFLFWALVAVCAIVEPVCCSYYPTVLNLFIQTVILAASTFLYMVQLIGVASTEWEKIVVIEALSGFESVNMTQAVKDFTPLKLLVFFTAEGEYILEGCMLTVGWILLFWHPGLAALRCFRVFRLLWFYEVEIFRYNMVYYLSPIFGESFMVRIFKVLKFSIKALSALGNEMFRLTNETRGGLFLMMLIFYSAYVLGLTLWIETAGEFENCYSGPSCTYTLMRLTFFDGNGFDFAYSLTENHRILFVIVIGYLCITAFGILNGLVGIFGNAFTRASHMAFNDEVHTIDVDELEQEAAMAAPSVAGDESSVGGDGGGSGGGGAAGSAASSPQKSRGGRFEPTQEGENEDGSSSGSESESGGVVPVRTKGNLFHDDSNIQDVGPIREEDTAEVHAFEPQKDIPPLLAAKVTSARNLLNPNTGPMDRTEIKQKVKAIFRGNSSRFAVEHIKRTQKQQFQQQQQQAAAASALNLRNLENNAHNASNLTNTVTNAAAASNASLASLIPGPPVSSPTGTGTSSGATPKKFNLRDIVRRASQQQGAAEVHPMDGLFGGGMGYGPTSSSPSPYRPKASRMDPVSALTSSSSPGNTSSLNLKTIASAASMQNTALTQTNQTIQTLTTQIQDMQKDMQSMSRTMQEMHRVFDRQHDLVYHMYQHINYLSHQLQVIHPEAKLDEKLPEFSIDMKKYKGPIVTAPPPSQPKTSNPMSTTTITTNGNANPALVVPITALPRGTTPPRGLQNYVQRIHSQAKAAGVGPPPVLNPSTPHTPLSTTKEETSTSIQLFESSYHSSTP